MCSLPMTAPVGSRQRQRAVAAPGAVTRNALVPQPIILLLLLFWRAQEIESLWHMGWIKLQPESLPTALRLQHAREQVARMRERMAAEAAPAVEALPLLRPWLLLLPWREVVELQEVAALLRHQQAGERERAMELLAQLAQRQPLHLPEVGGLARTLLHRWPGRGRGRRVRLHVLDSYCPG